MSKTNGGGVLGTLFRYEIKMLLRDTRTILIAIVAPLVLLPAYILILGFVESREQEALEEATYLYAITGTEAELAAELVSAAIDVEANDRTPPAHRLRTNGARRITRTNCCRRATCTW